MNAKEFQAAWVTLRHIMSHIQPHLDQLNASAFDDVLVRLDDHLMKMEEAERKLEIPSQCEKIICAALETPEGRQALAKAIIEAAKERR